MINNGKVTIEVLVPHMRGWILLIKENKGHTWYKEILNPGIGVRKARTLANAIRMLGPVDYVGLNLPLVDCGLKFMDITKECSNGRVRLRRKARIAFGMAAKEKDYYVPHDLKLAILKGYFALDIVSLVREWYGCAESCDVSLPVFLSRRRISRREQSLLWDVIQPAISKYYGLMQ